MKKVIFLVICMFLFVNTGFALEISCPEVASPGEDIKIHVVEDDYNGLKVKYNFNSSFVYRNMVLNSSWKSYYDGVDGFSIGNVVNQDKLEMDINFKVDIGAIVNKSYTLGFDEIEGNGALDKSVALDNVSCDIKLLSNINTLDSLVVEGVQLDKSFKKDVTSYKGTTENESIVIKASASDDEARVDGDIGKRVLKVGVNTFIVKVTSARGSVLEYKLYITRTVPKKSNDVTLKSLTLSTGKLDFEKDKFLYSVDVPYEVMSIDVEGVPNDSKASVSIDKPRELVVGENTIRVVVTAENGDTATYLIIVNRKDMLNGDASIRDLIIKNYDVDFDSGVYEYNLEINDEDKLDIEVILNDDRSKYKIIGNNNLKNNSIIEIVVTAEAGNELIYKIKVGIEGESNSNSIFDYMGIWPIIGFVILIIGVLVVKVIKTRSLKR